ncbi:MAG: ABC-type transport system involved in cytochrome c biogenesis permease component [Candidatus Methanohalarchaeum thermophilum]|uniref:Heme exporter protein B n=1 Tax=Methanohalarchaeum thermophilum TaxID=1903181 RepID=A0A1Q6DS80_METT1|nr:MAG: ABC-type transport system involved in cytochrome c biogenesis permease component [Candidatus Methanohalarchaeum thermophilum]
MKYLKKAFNVFWKDLIIELRSKEMINTMIIFSILVVLISSFAFGQMSTEALDQIAPGVLWIAFIFAGMLGIGRSFISEKDQNCLRGNMLAPVDWSAIYIGKTIGNLFFMLIMELITLIIFVVIFDFGKILTKLPKLTIILLLGTLGFVSVGTLLSAISVNTKTREMLLPVLLFPVTIPVILPVVESTSQLITQEPNILPWIRILTAYDIIFFVLSALIFNYVVEE